MRDSTWDTKELGGAREDAEEVESRGAGLRGREEELDFGNRDGEAPEGEDIKDLAASLVSPNGLLPLLPTPTIPDFFDRARGEEDLRCTPDIED